jgi:hypothetical protein
MVAVQRWFREFVKLLAKPRYHPERRYMRGSSRA